jgi:succinate-semialdehyde dehydrogenase/glutarate-semialdehyde dehydrogenase
MITRKVGPALAAGCTVVIKPSEETPLSALAAVELAIRAGIPKGVVNVVTGSRANAATIGSELATNPLVKKLSFTGSTNVGKLLMAQCAGTVKRTSMELGGNAPFIVFDDADLEQAVAGALAAKFRNAGQTCVCANRIYAQAGVYEEFTALLAAKVSEFVVGPGLKDGTVIGPLINQGGVAKSIACGARFSTETCTLEDAIGMDAFAAPLEALPCVRARACLSGGHFLAG